ncbi:mannosyltransferase [Corallibacter sp.]|uniref:mannosyltransferase n=1 Tax=Corallibacter sp. TaxID=2038084 RepID=UPI003AB10C70
MVKAYFFKLNKIPLLLALTSLLFYVAFAYDLQRTDIIKLLTLYTGLFYLFYKIIQLIKHDIKLLTWIAFSFRAIFILAIPNLSQDFYRFIWDGRMIYEGLNPYLFTPDYFIDNHIFPVTQAQELHAGMGNLSASHYTNYPPLNQLCFYIASVFAGKSILGSIIVLRIIIIAADFGILYFGKKLLTRLNLPSYNIFWYLLNPFIIIELTGNLHFEGVMIFFLIWSLYLLHKSKWQWSAFLLACSISIKLIPLIFVPLLYTNLGLKKCIGFLGIIGFISLLLFFPFLSEAFTQNYIETTGLWFQNFEFNASVFYIARAIGDYFLGFNIISYYGVTIAILLPFLIIILSIKNKQKATMQNLFNLMLFSICIYYFLATTVHPWYIATPVILSVFTRFKFALIWSFMVILSYTAYIQADYQENIWAITLEYIIVFSVFLYELTKKRNTFENKLT